MKTALYTFFFCLLLGVVPTVQAQEAGGTVSVKLNGTSLKGQSLSVNLSMNIDRIYVSSHMSLALTFALQSGNNILYLPPVIVHGSNKFKMFERTVALKGLEVALDGAYEVLKSNYTQNLYVSFNKSVAYRPWMNKCQLLLIGEVLDYNNNIVDTFTDTLEKSIVIRKNDNRRKGTGR